MNIKKLFRCSNGAGTDKWNTVPNWITALCFPLALAYVYLAANGRYDYALAVLGFMVLGDLADGRIANWCSQHSSLGKILDWLRDWWYGILIPLPFVLDIPYPFLLLYIVIFATETKLTFLSQHNRLAEDMNEGKHLILKIGNSGAFFVLSGFFLSIHLMAPPKISMSFDIIALTLFMIIALIVKSEYSRHI